MNLGHPCKIKPSLLNHVFKVRNMLEEVGVQLLVSELQIGLHIVGKHYYLDFHAFFFKQRLGKLEYLGMGDFSGPYLDGFRLFRASGKPQYAKEYNHSNDQCYLLECLVQHLTPPIRMLCRTCTPTGTVPHFHI